MTDNFDKQKVEEYNPIYTGIIALIMTEINTGVTTSGFNFIQQYMLQKA